MKSVLEITKKLFEQGFNLTTVIIDYKDDKRPYTPCRENPYKWKDRDPLTLKELLQCIRTIEEEGKEPLIGFFPGKITRGQYKGYYTFGIDFDDPEYVDILDITKDKCKENGVWFEESVKKGHHLYGITNKKVNSERHKNEIKLDFFGTTGFIALYNNFDPDEYELIPMDVAEVLPAWKEKIGKVKGISNWEKQLPSIDELKEGVEQGNRNNSAFILSCYYRDKGNSIEETKQELTEWNTKNKPALGLSELNNTIESAYTYPVNFRMKETSLMYEYGVFKKKDDGKYGTRVNCPNLAKLLLEADERKYIVAKDNNMIYRWNGSYYEADGETELKQRIVHYLDEYYTGHAQDEIIKFVKNQNLVERERFEPTEHLINLKNGVYNWETGNLESHSPDYYFLYEIPVEYNPDAECPKIEKFMKQTFEKRDIPLLYKFIGDCLQPTYKFKKALMLIGPTDTGKTQFLNIVEEFLGYSTISHVSLSKLCSDRFASSDLYGKLANISGDLDDTTIDRTSIFLMATGDDRLRAEWKFKDAFDFKNYAKLMFSCNDIPESNNRTDAYYNRWIIIEANNQVPEDKKIKGFYKTICTEQELSGLLNHALKGLEKLENNGYEYYRTTEEIRKFMEARSTPYVTFCTQYIESDMENEITKKELHERYEHYCNAEGYPVKAPVYFSRIIKDLLPIVAEEGQSGTLQGRPKVWRNITCTYEIEEQGEQ